MMTLSIKELAQAICNLKRQNVVQNIRPQDAHSFPHRHYRETAPRPFTISSAQRHAITGTISKSKIFGPPYVKKCKSCGYYWNWKDYTKYQFLPERNRKYLENECICCHSRNWKNEEMDNSMDKAIAKMNGATILE